MKTQTILIALMAIVVLGVIIYFVVASTQKETTTTSVSQQSGGVLSGVGDVLEGYTSGWLGGLDTSGLNESA
jgi:hypothetical protein